jgi:uncharacterized protein YecE (DUF72 family)
MRPSRPAVRIGISGWNYPKWRGDFYPTGLTHKSELAFASRALDSIEINGSFYSLLRPDPVKRWRAETPDGFVFAVKGSRFITHMKRLREVELPLANFFASGVLALEDKLGPILWQLPPSMSFDADRLERFFELLPRTTSSAVALARTHDHRLEGRAYVETMEDRPIRYALEVRHADFRQPSFVASLRRHDIALCVADTAGRYPDFEDATADFVYVRLHGDTRLYESGYGRRALERWADRIEAWQCGRAPEGARLAAPASPARRVPRDVYVYFDNDARGHAPFDAIALRALVDRRAEPSVKANPRSRTFPSSAPSRRRSAPPA